MKEMRFQCEICNRRFRFEHDLRRHKKNFHDEAMTFQCENCDDETFFFSKYNFNLHQHRVHGTFICPVCSKILPTHASLSSHKRHIHEKFNRIKKREKFRCEICAKDFKFKKFFEKHNSNIHEQDTYECKVCSKTFKSKKLFNAHRHKLNDPVVKPVMGPVMCEVCSEIISNLARLRIHMKSVHDTSKSKHCQICDKAFTYREYRNHFYSVHRKREIHTCDQCGKTFDRKCIFKRHLQHVHNKLKSHICNLCGKSFPQFQNLQKHMSGVHEKLKPFQCKLCGNYFSQTSSLSLHMKNIHKVRYTQKMDKELEQESEK